MLLVVRSTATIDKDRCDEDVDGSTVSAAADTVVTPSIATKSPSSASLFSPPVSISCACWGVNEATCLLEYPNSVNCKRIVLVIMSGMDCLLEEGEEMSWLSCNGNVSSSFSSFFFILFHQSDDLIVVDDVVGNSRCCCRYCFSP